MPDRELLECRGILATDESIAEAGTRIRVPRAEIRSIELRRGSPVQHPLVMFGFGIILLAAGLYEVGRVVSWLLHGGVIFDLEVLLLLFLPLGGYALYEAVQRVPILLVRTSRASRRLLFRRPVSREELQEFARALEIEFGYAVDAHV